MTSSVSSQPPRSQSALQAARVSLVAGGTLSSQARRQIQRGLRPRIDVLELETRLGARILDFDSLRSVQAGPLRQAVTSGLSKITGPRSQLLAHHILEELRDQDLVYVTGEDVGYPLALLMRLFRVNKPVLVVRVDQAMPGRSFSRRLAANGYVQGALDRIDRIGCHSNVTAQYLTGVLRVPSEKVCLLPPKVDTTFYDPAHVPTDTTHLPTERFMLSAGLEQRDYDTLLKAVTGLPIEVVIAAGSPWSRSAFEPNGSVPSNVRIEKYNPEQIRELYRGAELVALPLEPTLRTCGVTVVLESWAMGKAVIATRTIGQLEYARDGDDIKFVTPGDPVAMRRSIEQLLARPQERAALGAAGRRRVQEEFSLDAGLDHMENIFLGAFSARRESLSRGG